MGKAIKAKAELDDLLALKELIDILKSIASNRFFKTLKAMSDKSEFRNSFDDFFKIALDSEKGKEYFLNTKSDKVAVVAFTADGGFMAALNARIVKAARDLQTEHDISDFLVIGRKGAEKMASTTDIPVTMYEGVTEDKFAYFARIVKDRVMQLLDEGKVGKVVGVYPHSHSISQVKNIKEQVFPPSDLIDKNISEENSDDEGATPEKETKKAPKENVIFESSPESLVRTLAGTWLSFRLFEMFEECSLSGYAAQAQQLENSLDTLEKMGKKLLLNYRKAKRADIDKALQEVSTACSIMK